MPLNFQQDENRFEYFQPITLKIVPAPPAAANQLADVIFDEAGTEQDRPVYWDGAEWVDMGYGFHKRDGAVPGTFHKEMDSLAGFGPGSTAFLTPWGFGVTRGDGGGKLITVTDNTVVPGNNGGIVWARPSAAEGPRWDFSMYDEDGVGDSGGRLTLKYYNNQGQNLTHIMEATREEEGRISMLTNFRIPIYDDLLGGGGPLNPIPGDLAFNNDDQTAYCWGNGMWNNMY